MKEGKRTGVRATAYKTFHRPAQTESDILKLMVDALENLKPICEVLTAGFLRSLLFGPEKAFFRYQVIVTKGRQGTRMEKK